MSLGIQRRFYTVAAMLLSLPTLALAQTPQERLETQIAQKLRAMERTQGEDTTKLKNEISGLLKRASDDGSDLGALRAAGPTSHTSLYGSLDALKAHADLGFNLNFTSKDNIKGWKAGSASIIIGILYPYDSSILHNLVSRAGFSLSRSRLEKGLGYEKRAKEYKDAYQEIMETIRYLVKKGADINLIDKHREFFSSESTPLHLAVKLGRPELVSDLLKLGADPWKTVDLEPGKDMGKRPLRAEDVATVFLNLNRNPQRNAALAPFLPQRPDLDEQQKKDLEEIVSILSDARRRNPREGRRHRSDLTH